MPRKNQGCRSIGGGGEGASTSKKQKASSHSNSNRKDSPPFGDALSRVLRRSLLPRGYPMPSGFVGGMRLVNTFEDCFENLDGYNEEHTNIKLLASSVSQSIVSLASFKGRMRLFTCTGTVVGHMPSRMSILTSASLVRCYKDKSKIVDKLKIKVHLPNGKVAAGKLLKYDLYYNIAVVSIKSFPEFPAAHIHNQMQANLKFSQSNLVAIGRGFESGELMATGGTLLYKTSKLDCQELMTSTCKITKAGIGGPLIGSGGKFVGMNFYAKDETPFLPISILLKCLKHFDVFGRVVQPWLGLRIGSLQAQKLGIREEIHDSFPHAHGIYVEKLMAGKSINVWDHGERLGGAVWKCRYCKLTKSGGGVTRLKKHLAGKHGDIIPCSGVPSEVRRLMLARIEETKAKNKSIRDERLKMEQVASEPVARGPSCEDVFDDDEEKQIEWARRESLELHQGRESLELHQLEKRFHELILDKAEHALKHGERMPFKVSILRPSNGSEFCATIDAEVIDMSKQNRWLVPKTEWLYPCFDEDREDSMKTFVPKSRRSEPDYEFSTVLSGDYEDYKE